MRRIMMVSFITAALLGGQSRAVSQIELTFFRSAAVMPLVQPKTGSISGVTTDPKSHAVAGADVTALRQDANAASTLTLFSSPAGTVAQKEADSEILITIKRETCLGGCPSYSAQIYADGTVVYRGDDFVKVKGERRHKVAETKVLELVKAFERIDYFSLKDKYEVDANGRSVTDQPRTTTSISLNGRYKKVVDYYCAPKELVALEDLIDKLAGLYEYIGPL